MKLYSVLFALLCLTAFNAHADGEVSEGSVASSSEMNTVEAPTDNDIAPEEDKNVCDFSEVIGQKPEDVTVGHFPDDAFIRVLKPGQMVTMEYREGRINLNVDDNGIITSVTCG